MNPGLLAALVPVAAAAVTALAWALGRAGRIVRRIVHFLDDYAGQPARDGMEAKPGFMARLGSVEQLLADVVAETTPNGGGSMRDEVARTARDVADIKREQSGVRTRLELLQEEQSGRNERPHGTTGKAPS
jgi:hypothetical protein